MHKNFIRIEASNKDAWICVCGNEPHSDGFYPCDETGNEMEPVSGWNGLYVCHGCGRIIQQDSLEIIGQKNLISKNMAKKSYNVISPDGFPITCEPFTSKKAALDYVPLWCQRFESQGYYSAIGYKIPLNELTDYLRLVVYD